MKKIDRQAITFISICFIALISMAVLITLSVSAESRIKETCKNTGIYVSGQALYDCNGVGMGDL
jgi:hypothetical protein